jgi:hypothetical protein
MPRIPNPCIGIRRARRGRVGILLNPILEQAEVRLPLLFRDVGSCGGLIRDVIDIEQFPVAPWESSTRCPSLVRKLVEIFKLVMSKPA